MGALTFLFTRSFVNGVRRALTSPKRTISLVAFGLYYYFLIMRPFTPGGKLPRHMQLHHFLTLPSRYILDGIAFAVMAAASLFMLTGILTYKGGFKPADVDVLFPTPISPKIVLAFRIVRDYLITLFLPVFFGILGYRGTSVGIQSLIANYPARGADMLRMIWIAWMFMAFAWVSVGYAASMFVGRSDLQSDLNRKLIIGGLVTAYLAIGLSIIWTVRQNPSWDTALAISHWWALRIVLLPATAAAAIATGGIEADWSTAALGFAGLVTLITLSYAAAVSQVGWMYDQAAARGFDAINLRKLRKGGNTYALMGEMARRGKVRRGRLSTRISHLTFGGPTALVWKEMILQTRSMLVPAIALAIGSAAMIGATSWSGKGDTTGSIPIVIVCAMCAVSYFYSLFVGFAGFQEMLKRVDLLKPLPFTPGRILFWELTGKIPIPAAGLLFSAVVAIAINPSMYQSAFAGSILSIATLLEICGSIMFTVTLFPDYDDPTQRGLAMLFMLLCILVCSTPGFAVYFLLGYLAHTPLIVAAIPAAVVFVAITAGLATIAGTIYAGYNPSE
jgi:hypothetical protein